LIVPRSVYGKNTNRFYCRRLAREEKLDWEIVKIDNYKAYRRAEDPRAIFKRYGRLVPPEVFKLQRGVRVRVRNILQRRTSPEAVDYIMPEVRRLIAKFGRSLDVSAVPTSPEQIERNRRAYQHVARMEPARTADPIASEIPPSLLRGEVSELLANSSPTIAAPASSLDTSRGPPPMSRSSIRDEAAAAAASEKHRVEFLALRAKTRLGKEIERLMKLVEEREKNERR
jgi:hypothetical protein